MIDPTTLRSALHADWRSVTHSAGRRQLWQRCANMCVIRTVWGPECVWVAAALCWHHAGHMMMDTSPLSISLPTNQPHMILPLPMQNTPVMDAVIKWFFNLACLWLERKQPIHLTNEVISAIVWPCRSTYEHYTVCEVLSEFCWPCHWGGWKYEWIRRI